MSIGFLYPPIPPTDTEETITNLCPDSDPEDEDYIPSSNSSSSTSSSPISGTSLEFEIPPSEVTDLETETSTISWPTWEARHAKEESETYAAELAFLSAKEAHAAATYNSDELISLIHDFYSLLIEMGFWPTGCMKLGPHPLDLSLLDRLGYTDSAIYMLVNLPYIDSAAQDWGSQVLKDTVFVDYTDEANLLTGRHLDRPWNGWGNVHTREDWKSFVVEGKMIALAWIGNRNGEMLVLDTENGFLRNYSFMQGISHHTIEYKRFGPVDDDYEREHPTDFRRCPFITAADWFRNAIYNYRSLRFLPFLDFDDEDLVLLYPNFKPRENQEITKYTLELRLQKQALLTLYSVHNFQTPLWDRTLFLEHWKRAKLLIQQRTLECEMLWYTTTPEECKTLLNQDEWIVAETEARREEGVRERDEEMLERMRKEAEFGRGSKEEKKERLMHWESCVEGFRKRREGKVRELEERIKYLEEKIRVVDGEIEGLGEVRSHVQTEVEFKSGEKYRSKGCEERKAQYLDFFDKWREEEGGRNEYGGETGKRRLGKRENLHRHL